MALEILTSEVLAGLRHGFFTRAGGASSGIFSGLNCGLGSSDQREAVKINRARVAAQMGVDPGNLVTLYQTHSAQVATLHAAPEAPPQADAVVSACPELALAVLSADCQPVLLADARAGIVAAAHAGWRGARAGVLEATVDAMEGLGAQRDRIVAAIGPTISQRAYEVGADFFDAFTADEPASARFFAGTGAAVHFDLPSYGLARLRAAGIAHAEWTGHCTYSEPERFFSYRRSCHAQEADYGRLISAIRL